MARTEQAQAGVPGARATQARVLYRFPDQRPQAPGGGRALAGRVAVAVLLFTGGLLVGRASMEEPAAPAGQPRAGPPATREAPAPPAGAGTQDAAEVGPARTVTRKGVRIGVGYARTRAGAVAAATNYSTLLSSEALLDRAKREAVIDTIAAPEARGDLKRDLEAAARALARGLRAGEGVDVVMRAIPVGYRLERYDGRSAVVAVWATGIAGSTGGVEVRESWGVTTVWLRWVGGDWKQTRARTEDGPVPLRDDATPTGAARLIPEAKEFKGYNYAPGS